MKFYHWIRVVGNCTYIRLSWLRLSVEVWGRQLRTPWHHHRWCLRTSRCWDDASWHAAWHHRIPSSSWQTSCLPSCQPRRDHPQQVPFQYLHHQYERRQKFHFQSWIMKKMKILLEQVKLTCTQHWSWPTCQGDLLSEPGCPGRWAPRLKGASSRRGCRAWRIQLECGRSWASYQAWSWAP